MSNKVISFHYTLTNSTGEQLDSSRGGEPLAFLAGVGQIIDGLEKELVAMKVGDKRRVSVKAVDAYGVRDEKKVTEVSRKQLPTQKIKVGDRFRTSKGHDAQVVTVTKMNDTHITLDGNHPLAGQDLTFDVEITGVREATKEELSHGHVHGPGGHHH